VYWALTICEWLCTWPWLLRPECHAVCYVCVLHSLSDSIVSVQYSTALLCECKAILSNDLIVPGRLIDWSQTMLLKVKSSYRSTGIQIREWFLHYSLQWDHIVWTIIPWIGEHYSDNNHYTRLRSHGNNVCDVIIAHVISADAQIYRRGNSKVILGPAGRALRAWPAGKNSSKYDVIHLSEFFHKDHSTTTYM